jgi:hypothetical protein
VAFEKMLVDDGALIVKIWLHLAKKEQKKALKKLEQEGRVSPVDWKHYKLYDKFIKVTERAIRHTDSGPAPWHLVEATDRRYREFTVGTILLDAIEQRLQGGDRTAAAKPSPRAAIKIAPARTAPKAARRRPCRSSTAWIFRKS